MYRDNWSELAMVAEARRNAETLGAANAEFVPSLGELADRRFDLICSLSVFQHIPVTEGLATLTKLLRLLEPGGVAAIHFTCGGRDRSCAESPAESAPPVRSCTASRGGSRTTHPTFPACR